MGKTLHGRRPNKNDAIAIASGGLYKKALSHLTGRRQLTPLAKEKALRISPIYGVQHPTPFCGANDDQRLWAQTWNHAQQPLDNYYQPHPGQRRQQPEHPNFSGAYQFKTPI
jgi:hypothetical protein